jgi:hypothetical protein
MWLLQEHSDGTNTIETFAGAIALAILLLFCGHFAQHTDQKVTDDLVV